LWPAASANAQAFYKGALLISASEGATGGFYHTRVDGADAPSHQQYIQGDRDPLTLEYGLSDEVGMGLNMGTDIFRVNPAFYGIKGMNRDITAYMSELTLDVHYHFLVRARTDVACFFSFGFSSLYFQESMGDYTYKYNSGGGMLRAGIKAKYYFTKRVGIMGMASIFSMKASDKDVADNTTGTHVTTSVQGWAIEVGPCFKLLHPRK